jgi:hypothetical protein
MPIPIKPAIPQINKEDPFKNCKLNRKQFADALTPILNLNNDGFVLALDNPWGAGKTTFIKMWKESLIKDGNKCIYFNSWENDFENDPLLAILAELKSHVGNPDEFKTLLKKGGILAKNILPSVIGAIASKYVDTIEIKELIKKVSEAGSEILEEEIETFTNKKAGIEEFREALKTYVKNNCDKPLVLFIDELDRCNPHYAVKVLEKVKHFFTVEGIVFVLSIDKVQLCHSIKGYFGSENMDASEYLRRFIDIEFSLPKPKTIDYCNFLYDYYSFDDFIDTSARKQFVIFKNERKDMVNFASYLFDSNNVTLRQQEKIFSHSRLTLRSYLPNSFLFPGYFILLIYIKLFKKELFEKLSNKGADIQLLIDDLEAIIDIKKLDIDKDQYRYFTYSIAQILVTYNFFDKKYPKRELFTSNGDNTITFNFKSSMGNIDQKNLFDMIQSVTNSRDTDFGIDHFIHKINLIPNREE